MFKVLFYLWLLKVKYGVCFVCLIPKGNHLSCDQQRLS